jgi:adenine C2-methylase RlmN of 23S rRNA A2503 and tRNA A37
MKGIRIINRAEKHSAEILIYEDIGEGFFTSGVTAQGFLKELRALGVTATLRREKGHDIDAACGQLRLQKEKELRTDPPPAVA